MKQLIENMGDEVRSGYLVSAQMKKIWNIELNLAAKLLEVCQKYGLKIWAGGGTAIGAVRHSGFIPWDDDMDFMMLRDDYDKLCEVAQKEFKHPFFFQTTHTDKGFGGGFAKLRYDGTTMLTECEFYLPSQGHLGIFIDIFVQDALPKKHEDIDWMVSQKETVLNYITIRDDWRHSFLPDRFLMLVKGAYLLKAKAFWTNTDLLAYLEQKARSFAKENTGLVSAYMFEYIPKCTRKTDWFKETVWKNFELIKLPLIGDYHIALSNEYGDYMTPVKEAGMHTTPFVSPDIPYQQYIREHKPNYWRLFKDSLSNIKFQIVKAFR